MPEGLNAARIEQTSAWLGVFRDSRLPGMVNVSSQSLAEAADLVYALATALAEAKAQATRDAFEEAAQIVRARMNSDLKAWGAQSTRASECNLILAALATAPAETEKPETGEASDGR